MQDTNFSEARKITNLKDPERSVKGPTLTVPRWVKKKKKCTTPGENSLVWMNLSAQKKLKHRSKHKLQEAEKKKRIEIKIKGEST